MRSGRLSPGFPAVLPTKMVKPTSWTRSTISALWFALVVVGACSGSNQPPSLLWIEDQSVSVGQRLQVALTAIDEDGDPITFELSGLPAEAELAPIARTSALLIWSPTATDTVPGGRSYEATVRALDGQGGSVQQSFTVTVQPAYGVPVIELPVGLTIDLSYESHLTLEAKVRDDDSEEVELTLAEGPEGAQFLKSGPKSGLLHWKPEGAQLLDLVHLFTLVASDGTNAPVSHTLMVVLLGGSDELGCPGTAPTLVHSPLADQEVPTATRVEVQAFDQESQVQGLAMYWTLGDPDTSAYQALAFTPVDGEEDLFEAYLNPGAVPSGGTLLHYYLEATDNDDPTSEACDHQVVSPKEHVFTVGLYPPLSGPAACVDDSREPDDQPTQALEYGPGTHFGRMCGAQADHLAVDLEGGETLSVLLSHPPEHGFLELDLLSSDGVELQHASVNQGNLVVNHTAPGTGRVYVRVRSTDPALRLSYRLDLLAQLSPCQPDALEPNDSSPDASPLAVGVTEGLEICPGDQDWHRVSIAVASHVEIKLRSEPGFGDLDLSLLDASGSSVLASSESYGAYENLTWTTEGAVDLLVWVYGHQGGVNTYELEVITTPIAELCIEDLFGTHANADQALALFSHVPYSELVACPQSPDWYAVDLNGGELLEVTLEVEEGGELPSLSLLEGEDLSAPVVVGVASGGEVKASWEVAQPGRVHIVVTSGAPTSYGLTYSVTDPLGPCLPDRFEPNDLDSTASPIEPGVLTWIRMCPDEAQDTFSVYLEPFDHLMLTTSHLPGFGFTDLEVIEPSGALAAYALDPSSGPYLEVTALEGGHHLIRVLPYSVTASLGYDLAIWVD